MNSKKSRSKWRHFEKEIILLNVRWYLRYELFYLPDTIMGRPSGSEAATSEIWKK